MSVDLAKIKLLDGIDAVTDDEVDSYIEHLVQQGQGWGLRPIDRISLALARIAYRGQRASEQLDEMHRAMKGAQLESGRLKKKITELEARLENLDEPAPLQFGSESARLHDGSYIEPDVGDDENT